MRSWSPPRPVSGFVVDIQFYDGEVISLPCASVRHANREAESACREVLLPANVCSVASVAIYSAALCRETDAAR